MTVYCHMCCEFIDLYDLSCTECVFNVGLGYFVHVLLAFVVLGLLSLVPSREISWEECLCFVSSGCKTSAHLFFYQHSHMFNNLIY